MLEPGIGSRPYIPETQRTDRTIAKQSPPLLGPVHSDSCVRRCTITHGSDETRLLDKLRTIRSPDTRNVTTPVSARSISLEPRSLLVRCGLGDRTPIVKVEASKLPAKWEDGTQVLEAFMSPFDLSSDKVGDDSPGTVLAESNRERCPTKVETHAQCWSERCRTRTQGGQVQVA